MVSVIFWIILDEHAAHAIIIEKYLKIWMIMGPLIYIYIYQTAVDASPKTITEIRNPFTTLV